jgi:hypothetical protein
MEMPRKIVGGVALLLAVTLGAAPRSAPAQSSYFQDGTVSFSVQEQEWVNDMGTTDCAGLCPGRAAGCCPAGAMPL